MAGVRGDHLHIASPPTRCLQNCGSAPFAFSWVANHRSNQPTNIPLQVLRFQLCETNWLNMSVPDGGIGGVRQVLQYHKVPCILVNTLAISPLITGVWMWYDQSTPCYWLSKRQPRHFFGGLLEFVAFFGYSLPNSDRRFIQSTRCQRSSWCVARLSRCLPREYLARESLSYNPVSKSSASLIQGIDCKGIRHRISFGRAVEALHRTNEMWPFNIGWHTFVQMDSMSLWRSNWHVRFSGVGRPSWISIRSFSTPLPALGS